MMEEKLPDLAVMMVPSVRLLMVQATSSASRGAAVVEVDAVAEMEDPGGGVGPVPAGGEPGLELEALVLADEGVEDEGADALGLGVGPRCGGRGCWGCSR